MVKSKYYKIDKYWSDGFEIIFKDKTKQMIYHLTTTERKEESLTKFSCKLEELILADITKLILQNVKKDE